MNETIPPPDVPLSEAGSEKLVKVDTPIQEQKRLSKDIKSAEYFKQKLVECDGLNLTEDTFGEYWDQNGEKCVIKRFTWSNKNKIQVQVINYGARIISLRMPDRKGQIEDIVLGFDDLGGYLFYKKFYFGATIGRVANIVRNSTFQIDNKQYWINANHQRHHVNGGRKGFDQVVWNTHVDGTKVIMSHVSPNLTEGYPGDLLVRITFELTEVNEFRIGMEAFASEPTVVNLANLMYFNLAGHHKGVEEIQRHIVTLNCNCFTPAIDGIATGEIVNVVNTDFDFQVPKVLGKVMGMTPKTGFNENLCVNRGMDQSDSFVGRVLHPPSGRMLEVYSNQYGVNFRTANEFGYVKKVSYQKTIPMYKKPSEHRTSAGPFMKMFDKIYQLLLDSLKVDEEQNYEDLKRLLVTMDGNKSGLSTPYNTPKQSKIGAPDPSAKHIILTPLQRNYLEDMLGIVCDKDDEEQCRMMKLNIQLILANSVISEEERVSMVSELRSSTQTEKKSVVPKENDISEFYKSTAQIVGKERSIYRMHGAIALQTQNYPCCANFDNFPSCVLYPGQSYKHTITYKFWIRSGSPNKWIRSYLKDSKRMDKS